MKRKIDFQDGGRLRFQIKTILAILIYTLPRYYLPSLESVNLSDQVKKRKTEF